MRPGRCIVEFSLFNSPCGNPILNQMLKLFITLNYNFSQALNIKTVFSVFPDCKILLITQEILYGLIVNLKIPKLDLEELWGLDTVP